MLLPRPAAGGVLRSCDEGVSFVITPAFAQATGAGGGTDMLLQLVPFLLIFVIMWFLIIRPQQKRAKTHQEMIKNVRRGDTVVTAGGMVAKVSKVIDDGEIEAEIADGVRVRLVKGMIQDVRTKGEPVKS
jgi:preprotein translocase subunit YajC